MNLVVWPGRGTQDFVLGHDGRPGRLISKTWGQRSAAVDARSQDHQVGWVVAQRGLEDRPLLPYHLPYTDRNMVRSPCTGLGQQIGIEAGGWLSLPETWTAAAIYTDDAAMWVGSLNAEGLAVQVERVGLHICLDDLPG